MIEAGPLSLLPPPTRISVKSTRKLYSFQSKMPAQTIVALPCVGTL